MHVFSWENLVCFGTLLSKCLALLADDLTKILLCISDPAIATKIDRILSYVH